MGLVIKKLTAELLPDINQADDRFTVDSRLVPHYADGRLSYDIVPVTPYVKKYTPESREFYLSHIADPEKACFLAYLDGKVAGQVLLHRNWNRFAWIDDIGVDVSLRRRGIGRALLKKAEEWAKERSYPGVMLETQDTNVAACRFYARSGFVLGGFDTFLYRASDRYREEIALFWYLVFGI